MAQALNRFTNLTRNQAGLSAPLSERKAVAGLEATGVNDEEIQALISVSGVKLSSLAQLHSVREKLLARMEAVAKRVSSALLDLPAGQRLDRKQTDRLRRIVKKLLESVFNAELNDEWASRTKAEGLALFDLGFDGTVMPTLAACALSGFAPNISAIHKRETRETVRSALTSRIALEMSVAALGTRPQNAGEIQTIAQRDADLKFLNSLIREAAVIGDMTSRSDLTRFPEFLRDTVAAINELLDSILVPLREAIEVLEKVHSRDLTPRLMKAYAGDYKLIPKALNPALDQLMAALRNVADASRRVEEGAVKVSKTSQSLAAGATQQASTLEEIRAAVEELTERTRSNAKKANEASRLAQEAEDHAEKGNSQVQAMVRAMEGVSHSTDEISQIIQVIEDIAFQTKNLALNAGIEASRAGAQGTRFAVVAREVRDLAERSARSASETAELIEKTIQRVHEGVSVVGQTEGSLRSITQAVRDATTQVRGIAEATEDQARGIEQVNIALEQVEVVTQGTAQSSEAGAVIAADLSAEAVRLREEVSKFKIDGGLRGKRDSLDPPAPEDQSESPDSSGGEGIDDPQSDSEES